MSTILQLLEQLDISSRIGAAYSSNEYDRSRYTEINSLTNKLYKQIPGFKKELLGPQTEQAYLTPKIGVNAIIENDDGLVLLEKRRDDTTWGIIGGWCEVGFSPEENLLREIEEETGFTVNNLQFLTTVNRIPHQDYPFTSYHLFYSAEITGGSLQVSHESLEIAWKDPRSIHKWHRDHGEALRKIHALHPSRIKLFGK